MVAVIQGLKTPYRRRSSARAVLRRWKRPSTVCRCERSEIDHRRRAIALNPSHLWAYNGMAGLYLFLAASAHRNRTPIHAKICRPRSATAKEAVRLSPNHGTAYSNLTYFYMRLASYQLEHKQGIDDAIAAGIAYGQGMSATKPKLSDCAATLALLHLTRARSLSTQPQMDAEFLAAVKETLAQLDSAEQKR